MPAAIGVQLAQPDRPVVCVLGEGSAQYAIQAFWTAAAYEVPVTVLVLRNDEYAILKWFGMLEDIEGAPGLDLPALDVRGGRARLRRRTRAWRPTPRSCASCSARRSPRHRPELVEVKVAPGMALA